MSSNIKVDPLKVSRDYYSEFAVYANSTRALANPVDGMKQVYKRMLFTLLQYPVNKKIKSAEVAGTCMKYHPHGSQSNVLYSLANCDMGILTKQGNFGSKILDAAADRYTECCLNNIGRSYLGGDLINYAEMVEGDLGYLEPKYMTALIPYILTEGNHGMGVGLSTSIPKVNIKDLIKFYKDGLRKKNNQILKLEYGDIYIDMKKKVVSDMIKKGELVKIPMQPNIYDNTKDELYINETPDGIPYSKLWSSVKDFVDNDCLDIIDNSKNKLALTYQIVNKRKLKLPKLKERLLKKLSKNNSYNYMFVYNDKFCKMNLFQMRELTLKYLKECAVRKFTKQLEKLQKEKEILSILDYIKTSGLIKNISNYTELDLTRFLLKNTNYNKKQIDIVLSKPISKILKGSSEGELLRIDKKIEYIKSQIEDPVQYLESLYDDFLSLINLEIKTRYKK